VNDNLHYTYVEFKEVNHRHFILHKPYGYLSQFIGDLPKKKLLGEIYDFPAGTMAIGRLDEDSEGLILLTTDGLVSELVRGKNIEKEYYAQVDGLITPYAMTQLRNGVEIGIRNIKYLTKPAKVFELTSDPGFSPRKIRDKHRPTTWISITLTEGKFRQIRKMTATAGFPTLRLVRIRIGNLLLKNMKPGEVEEVEGFDLT
jgi:23S rRNA pseudouridine2457 synthase